VDNDTIVIVSGLPRSGTSMMMAMLAAGGLEPLTDEIRTPDQDNPKGYYEFERVKQIEHDQAWLPDAQGKVVKMIAALLKHLPSSHDYQVVFMLRSIDEVLASQKQMLIRRGEPTDKVSDERLGELFGRHVEQVQAWLADQPNFRILDVDYVAVLREPEEQSARINRFLGGSLDVQSMARVVDPNLHRQRSS
jgi:hypothetical protein